MLFCKSLKVYSSPHYPLPHYHYIHYITSCPHYIPITSQNIKTELTRFGTNGDKVIDAYLSFERDEAKLKIYIPYFINQIATPQNYNCKTEKVIFYLCNKNTHMMNFRFYLKHDPQTIAPRFPRERLWQIINSPMLEIKGGNCNEVSFGLPKLRKKK